MPGYGILAEDQGSGLLSWAWAEERLSASHDYWIASVRPDGRPHVMPVWGVFTDGRVWFSSGPKSRKVTNLRANPAVVVTTDDPTSPVIVEGTATEIGDDQVGSFAAAMDHKYDTHYGAGFYAANATFAVEPARAFGLDGADFTGSPTRWTFSDS